VYRSSKTYSTKLQYSTLKIVSCSFIEDTTTSSRNSKLSPGGLRQFTLSPIRDYDRTQELGLTLLGRVPMPALYPHTSLVYSYYHNINIYSNIHESPH